MYVNTFFSCVYFSLNVLFVGDGDTYRIVLLDTIIYKCKDVMNNTLEGRMQALKTGSMNGNNRTRQTARQDTKMERARKH